MVSTPPPSSREPTQGPQPVIRSNDPPTEPRRPTPSAPRLDLAKLNGLDSVKSQPTASQLSARSSRPPTPTGPRKHNTLDSPRLGRASMPGPIEPSSTSTAQELRKFSAEKAAEKSAATAVASSDRTPSRRSSVDGRRSVSPRPPRRNGSADSRVSERTRDKARDRDRERHEDRDRERDRDKDRDKDKDRDRDRRYRSSKPRTEKEKDKDHRKRSGDGSRGRGYDEDEEGSVKRHKTSNDEVRPDDLRVE
jgi:THO complex subunit 2